MFCQGVFIKGHGGGVFAPAGLLAASPSRFTMHGYIYYNTIFQYVLLFIGRFFSKDLSTYFFARHGIMIK